MSHDIPYHLKNPHDGRTIVDPSSKPTATEQIITFIENHPKTSTALAAGAAALVAVGFNTIGPNMSKGPGVECSYPIPITAEPGESYQTLIREQNPELPPEAIQWLDWQTGELAEAGATLPDTTTVYSQDVPLNSSRTSHIKAENSYPVYTECSEVHN